MESYYKHINSFWQFVVHIFRRFSFRIHANIQSVSIYNILIYVFKINIISLSAYTTLISMYVWMYLNKNYSDYLCISFNCMYIFVYFLYVHVEVNMITRLFVFGFRDLLSIIVLIIYKIYNIFLNIFY